MQTDRPGSLKDRFREFGAEPSDQLWNSIESQLDQQPRKRRAVFWWWFAGFAAALAVLLGVYEIGYHLGKSENAGLNENLSTVQKTEEEGELNRELISTHEPAEEMVQADQNSVAAEPEKGIDTDEKGPSNSAGTLKREDDLVSPGETTLLVTDDKSNNGYEEKSPSSENHLVISDEPIAKLPLGAVKPVSGAMPENENLAGLPVLEKNQNQRKGSWEIGFTGGILFPKAPLNKWAAPPPTLNTTADLMDSENTFTNSGITSMYAPMTLTDAKISRPISVDFSIGYAAGRRWTFTSGLGFNYFNSISHFSSSYTNLTATGDFVSLSIPVQVKFDFVDRRRVELFTGIGVNNEFPVYGRTSKVFDMTPEENLNAKSVVHGYMGSAQFSTGFAYRFNERLTLRTSPTVRYYFKQTMDASVPVLERKLWLGANVGLIWSL